ncbi:transposase [Geomonas sp. RF6]|uniref:REP-associated tyrosine transposase n=1 Tax=Geomonas sp. RF6 TaxID=2897342 RepID=UPI001E3ADC72|nr:transposase [Geomonas sp. RF6]UFS72267.1 transposase [Geomonas sp. RF6]
MSRALRMEYPGAFYHVTSRGNERKEVFKTQKDREKFLEYLGSATERDGAIIHVWCQMSNHYHLLLETPRGNLSEIMHHVNGAYTTYFNVKRKRSGHLFQGRYKAILVEASQYATEISRYIHLNPVRAGIVERPEEYQWSSYRGYIGEGPVPRWLRTEFIEEFFGTKTKEAQVKYRGFVEEALNGECESPLAGVVAGSILGREDFAETVIAAYLDKDERDVNVPALGQILVPAGPAPEEIVGTVEAVFGDSKKKARQAAMHFCHRYSGAKLREIAGLFGVKDAAITAGSRRFAVQLEDDARLREMAETVRKALEFKMYRRDP